MADQEHGWITATPDELVRAWPPFKPAYREEAQRALATALRQLQADGYLTRCRVLDQPFDDLCLPNDRRIPLSHWIADEQGPHCVLTHWIPSKFSLSAPETQLWHAVREDRYIRLLEATS